VQDGLEPDGIADEISRSWRRARELHRIDPGIARPGRVLSPAGLVARRERDEVFRLATPILGDFARRLVLHDAVLAYLDGEGWMLSIDGDRQIVDQAEEIDFRPGALWAEEIAGTNGPGTALVERKPVEVFASEHFVSAWHPWTCAAAPIQVPGAERPVGVVDLTGPWEVHRRHALLIAKAIARAIEERLCAVTSVRDEVVRYAFRAAHETGDALVAADARGRVIAVNDAAVRRRLVQAGALAGAAREGFDAALRSPALAIDADVRLETAEGEILVASPVRYEGTIVGAILRVGSSPVGARGARTREHPPAGHEFCRIHGESEPLRRAVELARTAARNDLPVVLCGEPGTGKELLARTIHSAGTRRGGPFVGVSCGAIPAQLVEAELFGYEPGAFTGARADGSPGRFEDARGGTLFLDEVSELPGPAQSALFRVLQEREIVRIGGSAPRPLDVRVIAASSKPLEAEIGTGRFRRDLYYRLAVLSIALPPLRERGDDIALLAKAFLAEAESEVGRSGLALGPDALDALRAHPWPGNVRELKKAVLLAATTAPAVQILACDLLLEEDAPDRSPDHGPGATLRSAVLESERAALLAALEAASWNVARAAEQLGVSRMTLYRRLQRHRISRALASR
jgi:transcriptional regulator of acetoin/glycerol metabolism